MKEKLRGLLGFLGLVEDDYGDYGPRNAPRPFSEQPEEFEPEWSPTPRRGRSDLPTQPRPRPRACATSAPTRSPLRTRPISVLEGSSGVTRGFARPRIPTRPRRLAFRPSATSRSWSPENYDDSRQITDLLRQNRAVVLATLDVDPALARRLVDFTAGTAYALNAQDRDADSRRVPDQPPGNARGTGDERAAASGELSRARSGMSLVHDLISIYIWILIITALLSWVPMTQHSGRALSHVKRIFGHITEPVLRPLRCDHAAPTPVGSASTSRCSSRWLSRDHQRQRFK